MGTPFEPAVSTVLAAEAVLEAQHLGLRRELCCGRQGFGDVVGMDEIDEHLPLQLLERKAESPLPFGIEAHKPPGSVGDAEQVEAGGEITVDLLLFGPQGLDDLISAAFHGRQHQQGDAIGDGHDGEMQQGECGAAVDGRSKGHSAQRDQYEHGEQQHGSEHGVTDGRPGQRHDQQVRQSQKEMIAEIKNRNGERQRDRCRQQVLGVATLPDYFREKPVEQQRCQENHSGGVRQPPVGPQRNSVDRRQPGQQNLAPDTQAGSQSALHQNRPEQKNQHALDFRERIFSPGIESGPGHGGQGCQTVADCGKQRRQPGGAETDHVGQKRAHHQARGYPPAEPVQQCHRQSGGWPDRHQLGPGLLEDLPGRRRQQPVADCDQQELNRPGQTVLGALVSHRASRFIRLRLISSCRRTNRFGNHRAVNTIVM